jgi:cyclopropane fatty-acyl-phospholipid synthase-like methyltransferase
MIDLPNSPSCERNKEVILQELQNHFSISKNVLEIGGGTGQHAHHFASSMPHLRWQTTDRNSYLKNLAARVQYAALDNLPEPLELDVNQPWTGSKPLFDTVYSANTLHIMGWKEVVFMLSWLPTILAPKARIAFYGPFNYGGNFTSESNKNFDSSLKKNPGEMGIRDFESLEVLMHQQEFSLFQDCEMPANNRLLIWDRG